MPAPPSTTRLSTSLARGAAFATKVMNHARYLRGPIEPWGSDPAFLGVYDEIAGHSLVDRVRCYMLWQLAHQALAIEGAAAEVGVYKGGTARLLGRVFSSPRSGEKPKALHLFDTFAGMPKTNSDRDHHLPGDLARTSEGAVRAFLADLPGVEFHRGFFPDTAAGLAETFAFVHVDADIYRSVLDCCRYFVPRMKSGGLLVFDDYGFRSCPGAKQAVDEFFAGSPETPIYLPTGQCLVVRV